MEFVEITEEQKAFPGEYVLHTPTSQIVLCGAFNREHNFIRAIASGRVLTDKIENFKKIKLTKQEVKSNALARCKGCGK